MIRLIVNLTLILTLVTFTFVTECSNSTESNSLSTTSAPPNQRNASESLESDDTRKHSRNSWQITVNTLNKNYVI